MREPNFEDDHLLRIDQGEPAMSDIAQTRTIRAPRGAERTAKSWGAEAAKRMLMNLSLIHI